MRKDLTCVPLLTALVLGLCAVKGGAADEKDVARDVNRVADDVAKKSWEQLVKDSGDVAARYDMEQLMHLFAKRRPDGKGGLGVGPKPGAVEPDAIEAKIINMAKTG